MGCTHPAAVQGNKMFVWQHVELELDRESVQARGGEGLVPAAMGLQQVAAFVGALVVAVLGARGYFVGSAAFVGSEGAEAVQEAASEVIAAAQETVSVKIKGFGMSKMIMV